MAKVYGMTNQMFNYGVGMSIDRPRKVLVSERIRRLFDKFRQWVFEYHHCCQDLSVPLL